MSGWIRRRVNEGNKMGFRRDYKLNEMGMKDDKVILRNWKINDKIMYCQENERSVVHTQDELGGVAVSWPNDNH